MNNWRFEAITSLWGEYAVEVYAIETDELAHTTGWFSSQARAWREARQWAARQDAAAHPVEV